MSNLMYGEVKAQLMEIRKESSDKYIKCYILTKDLELYFITRISKNNVYYDCNGEDTMLKKPILCVLSDVEEAEEAVAKVKLYYEAKLKNTYTKLQQLEKLNIEIQGGLI